MPSSAKNIARLNVEHFQRLLETEMDPKKRETITRLLAEEETKLREIAPHKPNL